MQGQIIQFAGSLLAILALAWIARALRLGPQKKLLDESAAHFHANQTVDGFEPVECAVDSNGDGAILRDSDDRILLLRPHGAHFAGRLVTPAMTAKAQRGLLVIETNERQFGEVTMQLDNAQYWADAINAVNAAHDT